MDMEKLRTDPALRTQIAADEGIRSTPYKDRSGNWTGGIGHNLTAHGASWPQIAGWLKSGIPDELIKEWFVEDIDAAIHCCDQIFYQFDACPDEVQRVLANMAFVLMYELWDWIHLEVAVRARNWGDAAGCILHSRFAQEDPNRCRRLAARMRAMR